MNNEAVGSAYLREQFERANNLFSAIVLAALGEAVIEQKRSGRGSDESASWAPSRDGLVIFSCGGIEPCEHSVLGMVQFGSKGIRPSQSLSREHGLTGKSPVSV